MSYERISVRRQIGVAVLAIAVASILALLVWSRTLAVTGGGHIDHGPWDLDWEVELQNWGSGTYFGQTYGWVDSTTESTFYRVEVHLVLQEICNGSLETDYSNENPEFNQPVPADTGITATAGYGTGAFTCPLGQDIRHDTSGPAFPAVWFFDSSPYATDIEKIDTLCIHIKGNWSTC